MHRREQNYKEVDRRLDDRYRYKEHNHIRDYNDHSKLDGRYKGDRKVVVDEGRYQDRGRDFDKKYQNHHGYHDNRNILKRKLDYNDYGGKKYCHEKFVPKKLTHFGLKDKDFRNGGRDYKQYKAQNKYPNKQTGYHNGKYSNYYNGYHSNNKYCRDGDYRNKYFKNTENHSHIRNHKSNNKNLGYREENSPRERKFVNSYRKDFAYKNSEKYHLKHDNARESNEKLNKKHKIRENVHKPNSPDKNGRRELEANFSTKVDEIMNSSEIVKNVQRNKEDYFKGNKSSSLDLKEEKSYKRETKKQNFIEHKCSSQEKKPIEQKVTFIPNRASKRRAVLRKLREDNKPKSLRKSSVSSSSSDDLLLTEYFLKLLKPLSSLSFLRTALFLLALFGIKVTFCSIGFFS